MVALLPVQRPDVWSDEIQVVIISELAALGCEAGLEVGEALTPSCSDFADFCAGSLTRCVVCRCLSLFRLAEIGIHCGGSVVLISTPPCREVAGYLQRCAFARHISYPFGIATLSGRADSKDRRWPPCAGRQRTPVFSANVKGQLRFCPKDLDIKTQSCRLLRKRY